ncbi:MAG: CBS domain-containing protein [Alphaproteobacteria bacterium]|nr:CBS domain-containing protein [Alphaproteobacteria bacterium]
MKGRLVEKLANRGCITINKGALISELIDLLSSNNIGAVVVVDREKKPVGMVSERDIIKNLNKNIKNIEDIMSTDIINCDLSFSSSELMELMNKNKIRHIPIIEKNKLLGIVSIGDVVKRLIEIYETENLNLKNYINS